MSGIFTSEDPDHSIPVNREKFVEKFSILAENFGVTHIRSSNSSLKSVSLLSSFAYELDSKFLLGRWFART